MKVRVEYSQKGSHFSMWLVDEETGRPISDEEVHEKFLNLEITGCFIKTKYPLPEDFPEGTPMTGLVIAGYTDYYVICKPMGEGLTDYLIPKKSFHRWYTLD